MRRIDLLPPEERRRRRRPGLPGARIPAGGVFGILLISGAVVLLVMIGLYVFYSVQLSREQERIAELDREIAEANQRLAELAPFEDLQAQLEAKQEIAQGVARTRFEWAQFLRGMAFVIPTSTSLQSFTAEAAPIDIDAPPEEILPPGEISFTGVAIPGYTNVASFLVQMNDLRYLSGVDLNSAQLDRETFTEPAINFEASAGLITEVEEEDLLRDLEPISQPGDDGGQDGAQQASVPGGTR